VISPIQGALAPKSSVRAGNTVWLQVSAERIALPPPVGFT